MASMTAAEYKSYHKKKITYYGNFFKYTPLFSLLEFALIFIQDAFYLKIKFDAPWSQFFIVFSFSLLMILCSFIYLKLFEYLKNKDNCYGMASLGSIFLYLILVINIFEQAFLPYKSSTISREVAYSFNLFIFGMTVSYKHYRFTNWCYVLYPPMIYFGLKYLGPVFCIFQNLEGYEANVDIMTLEFIVVPFVIVVNMLCMFFDRSFMKDLAARERLVVMANQDQLTGLYNRNYFSNHLTKDEAFESLIDPDVYLIMIDIDHFKVINDTYGHNEGDNILKHLSEIICDNTRLESDTCVRWGGEEILLIIGGIMSEDDVFALAERIRKAVEQTGLFTISLGVSKYQSNHNIKYNIRVVDNALYASKENGRNKTTYLSE